MRIDLEPTAFTGWRIDQEGLKTLIDDTLQGISESDRLLQKADRLEFSRNGGLKVYGPCSPAAAATQEGNFAIAVMTQDNRVRMQIGVGEICGIQPTAMLYLRTGKRILE